MSKKRGLPPPPNQPSMKSYLTGSSSSWKVGDSPWIDQKKRPNGGKRTEDQIMELEIHDSIHASGTFKYFQNQASALSYLNGQILMRKNQSQKMSKMEKLVGNFRKSGLTQKFMKIPVKILPQDKVNCQAEVTRANKVLGDLKMFKEEVVTLKKNCLDETSSVIQKKKEEFNYYSDQVTNLITLTTEMEYIVYKLEKSNNHINQSRVSKSHSIMENRRIKRRFKENRKDDKKDSFNRNVVSIKKFLPKYTNKNFEEVFEVREVKVPVRKNQFTKKPSSAVISIFDEKDEDAPSDDMIIIDSPEEASCVTVSPSKVSCGTSPSSGSNIASVTASSTAVSSSTTSIPISSMETSSSTGLCLDSSSLTVFSSNATTSSSCDLSVSSTMSTETSSSTSLSSEAPIVQASSLGISTPSNLPSIKATAPEPPSVKASSKEVSHSLTVLTGTSSVTPSTASISPSRVCSEGRDLSAQGASAGPANDREFSPPPPSFPSTASDSHPSQDENIIESEGEENVQTGGKAKKYVHEKIEREIKLKEHVPKLDIGDFHKMDFIKQKDMKSLRLLVELEALTRSLDKVIRAKISNWEMEDSEKAFIKICDQDSENVEESNEGGDEIDENVNFNQRGGDENKNQGTLGESRDEEVNKKTLKRKYKELIKQELTENNNKIKRKKLEKNVLSLSETFDKRDTATKKDLFAKCLGKIKNVEVVGKYVNRNT